MRVLLDERQLKPGIDFQAVVAVSDLLAIGALNMMAERGIRSPPMWPWWIQRHREGRLVRPPLTSVSLLYERGRLRGSLLATLDGQDSPIT
jgi:DNA-binding LacI/PurR family transcriptional regulator